MKMLMHNNSIWIFVTFCLVGLTKNTITANSNEKCSYRETVDLTNHTRFENGSYLYHDVIVSKDKVSEYNYRLFFLDRNETAETHVRGCVCNSPKHCIKLCCERGQYFNELTFKCEEIPSDLKMPSEIKVFSANGDFKTVNIFDYFMYQVGLPCEYPESLSMDGDSWDLQNDGWLYINNDNARLDTVSYCLTPFRHNGSNDDYALVPMSCPKKAEISWTTHLNAYAMIISVIFFIPTVVVYLLLRDLRGNMRGKLLICYLMSLIVAYSIIGFINISHAIFGYTMCSALGFTCYYFFMAAFLWLSVLCYDIWINFKEDSLKMSNTMNRTHFIYYSLYVWGTAAVFTIFTIWAQWSDTVSDLYKPGIGIDMCWLNTNKWSAGIYFYGPNMIILIFNMITFGHMAFKIHRIRCDLPNVTQKEKFLHENRCKENEQQLWDPILPSHSSLSSLSGTLLVLFRLFVIMGISWIMDILSYCLRNYEQYEFLFILTDFCNAIQGVMIFVLFVCRRKIWNSLRNRNPQGCFTSKLAKNSAYHDNCN